MKCVTLRVEGQVQGVGFRWWAKRAAERRGLVGSVVNLPDGAVEMCLQGPDADVDALVAEATGPAGGSRPGRVRAFALNRTPVDPARTSFEVVRR